MQYAVFVYVSSAQAVIQDLFLFLFKTKTVSEANTNKPREKRAPYYGGKKNQKEQKKSCKNGFFTFFLQKICLCQKKAVSLHPKSVNHFPLWVNNQKTLYYVSTIQV